MIGVSLLVAVNVVIMNIGLVLTADCAPDCLKCGSAGCMKCNDFIVYPNRECVTHCPHGHRPQWSTFADYMGRVCIHRGTFMGLSNDTLTILTGIISGTALCIVIVTFAVIYVQYYKRKLLLAVSGGSDVGSECDETPERKEFLKQLDVLRPYAPHFLEMLNDTRRQLRDAHHHQDGDPSAFFSVYRPIIRDLAKLLLLLNKPYDRLYMPEDWEHLYNWAEKTLKRCVKRQSDVSQPSSQVAQLIHFLQSPIEPTAAETIRVSSTNMSTFKPEQALIYSGGSSPDLQQPAKHDAHYESSNLNPQWKFDYTLIESNNLSGSQFNPILWKNSSSSKENVHNTFFLDDDFCQLGFRPQDEITTEL